MKPMFRVMIVLCFSVSCLLPVALAQVAPTMSPFSADMSYSGIAHGSRPARDMDGKMYFGHDHMRIELQGGGPGGPGIILINYKTQVTDVLMPAQQMYIEHKSGEMAGRRPGMMPNIHPFRDPSNPCAEQEGYSCKDMGADQVNGRACEHWQITDKNGRVNNTWIDQKLHFPIKNVSEDGTWELTNIKEGEPAADLFEIPAGYHKMDMSNIGGMQGGPPPQP